MSLPIYFNSLSAKFYSYRPTAKFEEDIGLLVVMENKRMNGAIKKSGNPRRRRKTKNASKSFKLWMSRYLFRNRATGN